MPDSRVQIPETLYTSQDVMQILGVKKSKYYSLMRPDSRGVVMLEYSRNGAGGRIRHTRRQLDDYYRRIEMLGNARLKLVPEARGQSGATGRGQVGMIA